MKLLMFFALSLLFVCPVYAQHVIVDISKIKEIPDYESELTEDAFLDQSELYEEEPQNDKFLAYRIRLPKSWYKTFANMPYKKGDNEAVNQRFLGQVSKYYGPGRIEALSKFEIEAQSLDFEITAKNWFMKEILARGYILEGLKVFSDKRVEALYVVVEGDTSFVVRAIAEINGTRMIVASYYVPDVFWEQERALQQRAMESFEFISPEVLKIEMTRSYSFLDLLSFDYPASWRLIAPHIFSIESMEAKLIKSTDKLTLSGEMHISIISTEVEGKLVGEIAFLKEEMTDRGLEIGDFIEITDDYAYDDHIYFVHAESYKVFNSASQILEHEYWIAILEEDRYYYVVTMLTPSRDSEFYVWSQNVEAFRTVIESFRL